MARLFEYQGKQLLKAAKVPVPQGGVATTPQEARKIAEKIGKPVVTKSQIWAGGRGKAGAVRNINSAPAKKIAAMTVDVLRGFRLYDALNLALKVNVPTTFLPAVAQ